MDTYILVTFGTIAILLVLSAFFSGSETALTAASPARMHTLEKQGDARARVVNALFGQKDRLIGAILLGNNLVSILASALATSLLIGLAGEAGVVYATLGMTLLILIFAEVLPKTYAIHNADGVALRVAGTMRVVVRVFGPVTLAVQWIVRSTLSLFGVSITSPLGASLREEELRGAIELHTGEGEEDKHAREMLRSILDLADIDVEEIMTHRKNVATIDASQPTDKIVEEVLSSPYTRLPLWRDDPDNIVGVLHAKALLRAVHTQKADLDQLDMVEIAHNPWFIPESTDLLAQLQAFRQRQEHFAIVVDEYGEVLGIVTLEDILEEIVGEIADEYDTEEEAGIKSIDNNIIEVDARIHIDDLNEQLGLDLPEDVEYDTVAGYVLANLGRVPAVGASFENGRARFTALAATSTPVARIGIEIFEGTD